MEEEQKEFLTKIGIIILGALLILASIYVNL